MSDLRRLGGVLALDGLLLLVVLIAAHPPTRPLAPSKVALTPGPGPLRASALFAALEPQSPPLQPYDLPGEGPVIALAPRPPGREAMLRPDPTPLIAAADGPPEPPEFRLQLADASGQAPGLAAGAIDLAVPVPSAADAIAVDLPSLPAEAAMVALTQPEFVPAAPTQPERGPEPLLPGNSPAAALVAFEPQMPVLPSSRVEAPDAVLASALDQPNMAWQEDLADALMLVSLTNSWERPDPDAFVPPPDVITRPAPSSRDPLAADPRKDQFVSVLMPLIMEANARILGDRTRLLQLVASNRVKRSLSDEDAQFLARLREEYHAPHGGMDELLRRVDVVPPSMALAQAAQESGWGALRDTRAAYPLFGQMVERRLARFQDATAAVEAYIGNLNSHNAYGEFRAERARLRAAGRQLEGQTLVSFIQRYSERGMDYVNSVKGLIGDNNLGTFDRSHWDDRSAAMTQD